MQVILLEKLTNLGNLGDVVRVKDGFARNFLIPQRKARRATEAAIADFAARRAELEKLAAEKLAAAQAVGDKLKGLVLEINQRLELMAACLVLSPTMILLKVWRLKVSKLRKHLYGCQRAL